MQLVPAVDAGPAQRYRVRRATRLRLDQLVQAARVRRVAAARVPAGDELTALALAQQRERADRPVGILARLREDPQVVAEQRVGCGAAERRGADFDERLAPRGLRHDRRDDAALAALAVGLCPHLWQLESALERRVPQAEDAALAAQAAHPRQLAQAVVLRQSLCVRERLQRRLARALQQRAKARFVAQLGGQRQHACEEADHLLQLGPRTVCRRRRHEQTRLAAVVVQQDVEGSEMDHERRSRLGAPERGERAGDGGWHSAERLRRVVAGGGAAAALERQRDREWRGGERTAPVLAVLWRALGGPVGLVAQDLRVLERRLLERRGPARVACAVEL